MHPTLAPFLLSLFGGATAHSWVTLVGTDGRSRGGITHREGELFLQRYVCPLATLEQCQAAIDPKHGITLSDDAMRPCRQDRVSDPMARVAPGEPFSVAWMGNGHAGNGQSDGTCVRIRLAPFKQSPEWVDFDQIGADCLAYWKYGAEGRITTSAEITLPDGTPEGSYTLHWLWNFTDFWYASCADVEVGPVSSDGFDGSSPSPSLPPSTGDGPDVQKYLQSGCAALADTFCQSYIGTGSYCKSYKTDECGRSVCLGGAFLLPCGTSSPLPSPSPTPLPLPSPPSGTLPLPPPPAASPSPEAPPSTSEPPQLTPESLYLRSGCAGTDVCAARGSHCKDWQRDECGRAVCHGDTHSLLVACSELSSGSPPPQPTPPLSGGPPAPSPTPPPPVASGYHALFAYIEDPINTQVFGANYDADAVLSLAYFVVGMTPNSYAAANRTLAMLLSLQSSGWSGKVLLQPDLTTNAVCDVGGAGCGGDVVCAVLTCFETLRRVLGETFAASVDGVLLENENAASPALKACSTGEAPARAACLNAFRSHSGASDWEVWSIPDFTAYGSAGYAAVPRFAQFYNMYSRGDGGSYPCVKCGPSPGCQLDFEAWRAQPACENSGLLPQFGGAVCFQDTARSVGCAHACGRDVPCLTQADAATSTAFGGGIYDPALNISPAAIGEYLGGIYTSGGVHRRPAGGATAVATLPFTTASQPSLVAKIRNAADVEELAAGMLSAFAAAADDGAGASQPLRIAAWGAPCWLVNSTARARVAPCSGI